MLTTCMTSLLPTKASPCCPADERGPLETLSCITVHCGNGDLGLERRQIAPVYSSRLCSISART